jgi:hypothetical protein
MDVMTKAANPVMDNPMFGATAGRGAAWLSYYYFTARAETD